MMISGIRASVFPLACIAAVVFLSACSPETSGKAQSSEQTNTSGAQTGDGNPADISVADPLDVEAFIGRPCDLVGKRVVRELGGGVPNEPKGELAERLGPTCEWELKSNGQYFYVSIGTVARDMGGRGLAELYENIEAGMNGYVESVKIPGHPDYPAAYGTLGEDERPAGYCPVNVATSNDLAITVSFENVSEPDRACSSALKVAASVIDTLKKGD